jgi:hypothetical protein
MKQKLQTVVPTVMMKKLHPKVTHQPPESKKQKQGSKERLRHRSREGSPQRHPARRLSVKTPTPARDTRTAVQPRLPEETKKQAGRQRSSRNKQGGQRRGREGRGVSKKATMICLPEISKAMCEEANMGPGSKAVVK